MEKEIVIEDNTNHNIVLSEYTTLTQLIFDKFEQIGINEWITNNIPEKERLDYQKKVAVQFIQFLETIIDRDYILPDDIEMFEDWFLVKLYDLQFNGGSFSDLKESEEYGA